MMGKGLIFEIRPLNDYILKGNGFVRKGKEFFGLYNLNEFSYKPKN